MNRADQKHDKFSTALYFILKTWQNFHIKLPFAMGRE
jgi:hypothetical protein